MTSHPAAEPVLPTPIVTADLLARELTGPQAGRIVILDVSMGATPTSPHIPGALRFDLDGPMSDHTSGLPHTMPPADAFQQALRGLGIRTDSHVVVTETDFLFAAARPWWMLRAVGFDAVSILDGGNPAWRDAGQPLVTEETPAPRPGDVVVQPREGLIVDQARVLHALRTGEAVVDARSRARFSGAQAEPRPGLRTGHMPGALNLPYTDLQKNGRLLPIPELRERIGRMAGRSSVIASCGSGVTACVVALAAVLAGCDDVAVYDGSWSEWGLPDGPRVVAGA